MYHKDKRTSVQLNEKECHPKDNKNVNRKEKGKTKLTNEGSYVVNVAYEQKYSAEAP
jgi:hypothetical protein